MSQNVAAIRKEPLEMTQDQKEHKLRKEFSSFYTAITKNIEIAQQEAQGILFEPHQIIEARNVIEKLNVASKDISQKIIEMASALENPNNSPEFEGILKGEIDRLKESKAGVLVTQKDMNKSEKCGSNELDKVTKEKDFWTNVFVAGVFAAVGVAGTMATAESGQLICLSVLTSVSGFTLLAATKGTIVEAEYKFLNKAVESGEYWCNDGPQRPGAKRVVKTMCSDAKQRIQKRLHLG